LAKIIFTIFFLNSCASKLVKVKDVVPQNQKPFKVKIEEVKSPKLVNNGLVVEQVNKPQINNLTKNKNIVVKLSSKIAAKKNTSKNKVSKHALEGVAINNQPKVSASKDLPKKLPKNSWVPKAWPFGLGEVVTYRVRYGPIVAGNATFTFKGKKNLNSRPAYHMHLSAKSSSFLNVFYKIDDYINSYVSEGNFVPIYFEFIRRESKRWGTRFVKFNHKDKTAHFKESMTKKGRGLSKTTRKIKWKNYAQDIVSSFYFFRMINDRRNMNAPVYDKFKTWGNQMVYIGKERITVKAGSFNTLKYKMNPKVQGDLKTRGNVYIWYSDDEKKLPIQFKAQIKVGSVTGELAAYKPGAKNNYPLPIMLTPYNLK